MSVISDYSRTEGNSSHEYRIEVKGVIKYKIREAIRRRVAPQKVSLLIAASS